MSCVWFGWLSVRRSFCYIFFLIELSRATWGQGWMAVKEQKKQRSFGHGPARGAPIVWGPLGVYHQLCLSPTISTLHRHTKRLFVAIVSPSLHRAAATYNRFKHGGGGTKTRDYLFFKSAMITFKHGRGFVSLHSQIFRRYEKGLCYGGRICFCECRSAPCSSYVTCIIFNISLVYYFCYCDLD